jgi:hypothetical protein
MSEINGRPGTRDQREDAHPDSFRAVQHVPEPWITTSKFELRTGLLINFLDEVKP